MTDPDDTPPATLLRAARIGKEAGVRYVYAGNLPGMVRSLENTYCHNCNELLVERVGFHVRQYRMGEGGCCPSCSTAIPGVWW
jgi:pyruvate formate lyase activating enzyme